MKLTDIPNEGVTIKSLALDRDLASDIQLRLIALGILDPPADGAIGSVSELALIQFAKLVGLEFEDGITKQLAQALLDNTSATLTPIEFGNDFASRIIRYMQVKGYWVARLPGFLNIVYVEGVEEDGTLNADTPNQWNDRRIVIEIKKGKPTIVGNWQATTEPGRKFTMTPENVKGAARIAFGQYKAWRVGLHKQGKPSQHEALRQAGDITVHRDLNKDFKRTGYKTDVGSAFFINQHKGFNMPVGDIGTASAGCLVGRTNKGHEEFMALVKTDLRFKANNGYMYMTTVIAGDDLKKVSDELNASPPPVS
jgi:hypothetical protein